MVPRVPIWIIRPWAAASWIKSRGTQTEVPVGRSRRIRSAMAAFLGLSAVMVAGGAGAQGMVKNTFGDWQMRCETPPGAAS